MEHIPTYVYIVFILTTLFTVTLFYFAANKSKSALAVIVIWMAVQGSISFNGFYTVANTLPPRMLFSLLPPLAFITGMFLTSKGRRFIDGLSMKYLVLVHTARIPVELSLFWLFIHKAIPQIMTFEGRNFDILSGITAIGIFYYGFVQKKLNRMLLLLWNFICFGLLINIVTIAILAMPTQFQQIAFDQPNTSVLYFPFIWLPSLIVPLVLMAHLASIRQLLRPTN
jgi:hypothetical protein